jgi:hypothetical protein
VHAELQKQSRKQVRYLGLLFDANLSFQAQVEKAEAKMAKCANALAVMSHHVPIQHRRAFFYASCSNILWPLFFISTLSDALLARLIAIYNRALRKLGICHVKTPLEVICDITGTETFMDFYERLVCKKLLTIDARRAAARNLGFDEPEWLCNIFCPIVKDVPVPTRKSARINATAVQPLRYSRKALQNELVYYMQKCKFDECEWNGQQSEIDFGAVKESVEKVQDERFESRKRRIVNTSMYKTKLKELRNVDLERELIYERTDRYKVF